MQNLNKQIDGGLAIFRKNAGIEGNEGNLLANLNDELTEILRTKTIEELVGEMCDVFVFAYNGLKQNNLSVDGILNHVRSFSGSFVPDNVDIYIELIGPMKRLASESKSSALYQLCTSVMYYIQSLGYNPHLCIIETIKKINSRDGEIDKKINKWVKSTTTESKAKWYTPNFSKCKVVK